MTLKIYGNMSSSAFRVVWAAEELGLDYDLIDIATDQCATDERLARLNPNKKIPVIDDDGIVLWESMAINLYLAKKTGGDLAPRHPVEDAQMQMWSYWVSIECVMDCFAVLNHTTLLPETQRKPDLAQAALSRLQAPLAVLDDQLTHRAYLIDDRFTIADLNVASIIGWLTGAGTDLSAHPNVADWMTRCSSRPAARKCMGLPPEI